MGEVVFKELSEDGQYQFTLWDNEGSYIIEIKKYFKRKGSPHYNYGQFDRIRLTPQSYEIFKKFICKYSKKASEHETEKESVS